MSFNFGLCCGRLASTINRLRSQPSLLTKYNDTFQEQLKSGISERVEKLQGDQWTNTLSYKSCHRYTSQTHNESSQCFRCVYQNRNWKSLNDTNRGPVLLNSLIAILLRFRQMKIVILCDIKKTSVINWKQRKVIEMSLVICGSKTTNGPLAKDSLTIY